MPAWSWWAKARGGSSPFARTTEFGSTSPSTSVETYPVPTLALQCAAPSWAGTMPAWSWWAKARGVRVPSPALVLVHRLAMVQRGGAIQRVVLRICCSRLSESMPAGGCRPARC